MKFPSWKRTKIFFGILLKKLSLIEKIIVSILLVLVIADLFGAFSFIFNKGGNILPTKGGILVEGMVGQPKFINPLYAKSEVDKALSSLVFSGLVAYDKQRRIVPGLAQSWDVSENKQDYTFYLKKNVKWHDGSSFSADDVVYTLAVLQNPDYNEAMKPIWDGVTIEKKDGYTVVYHLPKPYPLFLENATVGILPVKQWQNIAVKDFAMSTLNINPIGTGPYVIDTVNRDSSENLITSIKFVGSDFFVGGSPYIENLETKFYKSKDDLIKGFSQKEFSSFGLYSADAAVVAEKTGGYNNYNVNLPQYVALFFNMSKVSVLNDKSVRQALAYAIDKNKVNTVATYSAGVPIDSPILPGYLGYNAEVKKYSIDQKGAIALLTQAGWSDQNGDGVEEKDVNRLEFDLVTSDDPQFVRTANELSAEWAKIGVKANVKVFDVAQLERDYITTRNYDLLLIGQNIGGNSDLYPYWHSTQIKYPGLNLAVYANGEVDKLLEEARQSDDTNVKIKDYKKFQDIVAEELPAIFIYQPVYVYKIYDKVRGIDLSGIINTWDRFYDVANWYVKYRAK
ncbi:MAG TPA: peptide ABC transporter substrate-binding protein [Patescibacteria group bacterium]|nr:peptide ABC transporter substrate-binding protein [Patescibacteria group bacterium]